MFKDNAERQIQREIEYRERYVKFNEIEKMKQQAFMNSLGFNTNPRDRGQKMSHSVDGASIIQKLHE
jgi:hypothetical protein